MFKYRYVVLNCSKKQYAKLIALGYRVIVALTGNANYTPVPTLIALQAATDAAQAAFTKWGGVHNRGSKSDYEDLLQKIAMLHNMIKALSENVNNTAQLLAGQDYALLESLLSGTGFDMNKVSAPVGKLPMVKGFRVLVKKNLSRNEMLAMWLRPEGTKPGDVSFYIVRRGVTADFNESEVVSMQTGNRFLDVNNGAAVVTYWYWIIPCNSASEGVPSQAIMATLLTA